MSQEQPINPYIIPGAIIIAGLLIAGAVFFSGGGAGSPSAPGQANVGQVAGSVENIRPVTEQDHVLGDINAPVKIVEFSDLECPFCKRFHVTMKQVMEEYGDSGQVAWVYRHFPLTSIHPGAAPAAIAAECAAELGGNLSFWDYIDTYFETTNSDNTFDDEDRAQIAASVGLDRGTFESCVAASDRLEERVNEDTQDAFDSGGQGTPYSVLIVDGGTEIPVSGAVPYEQIKQIIDQALGS